MMKDLYSKCIDDSIENILYIDTCGYIESLRQLDITVGNQSKLITLRFFISLKGFFQISSIKIM